MKKALITGITGQDGSYLAEFLLEKGYEVHGITRRASLANTARIEHIMDKITLHDGDLSDSSSLIRIINIVQPDEIYNLAAQSHVQVSFDVPEYSGDVDALGVLRILEACRILGLTKKTKVYQASTSELYGKVEEVPQRETTPFHPYSPYAVAKQYGFWIVKEYREAYGMFHQYKMILIVLIQREQLQNSIQQLHCTDSVCTYNSFSCTDRWKIRIGKYNLISMSHFIQHL